MILAHITKVFKISPIYIYLYIYLPIHLSIYIFSYLQFIYLSIYLYYRPSNSKVYTYKSRFENPRSYSKIKKKVSQRASY